MKKILFRADAGPAVGTGDLISLIHLSARFKADGWQPHFAVRDHDAGLKILSRYGIRDFLRIDKELEAAEEVRLMNDYVKSGNIDAIFLEITERSLAEYTGLTKDAIMACVDFGGAIPEGIDLVVNWDVDAKTAYDTRRYHKTRFLLGPEYVILPEEFDFKKIDKREHGDEVKKVLVTMGGADEENFTQKVLDCLVKNDVRKRVSVILGGGYRFGQGLKKALDKAPFECDVKENLAGIFEELMGCDMAVSAGGLTSFELMATRTPSALIATQEHQIKRCKYFQEKGWARYLGFKTFGDTALVEAVSSRGAIPPRNIFKTHAIVEAVDEISRRR